MLGRSDIRCRFSSFLRTPSLRCSFLWICCLRLPIGLDCIALGPCLSGVGAGRAYLRNDFYHCGVEMFEVLSFGRGLSPFRSIVVSGCWGGMSRLLPSCRPFLMSKCLSSSGCDLGVCPIRCHASRLEVVGVLFWRRFPSICQCNRQPNCRHFLPKSMARSPLDRT